MGKQKIAAASRSDPFTEEDRRIIVTLLDNERWRATLDPSPFVVAIIEDRASLDYEDDTDAVNPPSGSYLREHGRRDGT